MTGQAIFAITKYHGAMVYGKIRVKAPATVSNLNCGFDVIGLALDEPCDILEAGLTDSGVVEIAGITGCDSLSRDPGRNVAGAVLQAFLRKWVSGEYQGEPLPRASSSYSSQAGGVDSARSSVRSRSGSGHRLPEPPPAGARLGFTITLHKGIRPGSGIGSSGASAAAAAFAANWLTGGTLTREEMIMLAMEGERVASGARHADNVAPSLLGGITLVRSYDPLDVVELHVPPELCCVVIHPAGEIRTSVAREILDKSLPLTTAITQWGNLAGLVAGLYREDYDLIGRSLIDRVAEPKRAGLIAGFGTMKASAMEHGALGAGISGAGPSLFALCRGAEAAAEVMRGLTETMHGLGIDFDGYLSVVNRRGTEIDDRGDDIL